MTGHGQSQKQSSTHSVDCEVRAINNRYLKIHVNWDDRFAKLETAVHNVVRQHARRGTFYVTFRLSAIAEGVGFSLNLNQLESYRRQLQEFDRGFAGDVAAGSLLGLPGVVVESGGAADDLDEVWPLLESALQESLEILVEMRAEEGASMAEDLAKNTAAIEGSLKIISDRAPLVSEEYGKRLHEKINAWLEPLGETIPATDIVREVGIFADRSDISEEIVRLRSHLEQFAANLASSRGDGRKLEFVTQEMLRETNTIGSKANDSAISHQVVDIKTAIERIREMVQNIE